MKFDKVKNGIFCYVLAKHFKFLKVTSSISERADLSVSSPLIVRTVRQSNCHLIVSSFVTQSWLSFSTPCYATVCNIALVSRDQMCCAMNRIQLISVTETAYRKSVFWKVTLRYRLHFHLAFDLISFHRIVPNPSGTKISELLTKIEKQCRSSIIIYTDSERCVYVYTTRGPIRWLVLRAFAAPCGQLRELQTTKIDNLVEVHSLI